MWFIIMYVCVLWCVLCCDAWWWSVVMCGDDSAVTSRHVTSNRNTLHHCKAIYTWRWILVLTHRIVWVDSSNLVVETGESQYHVISLSRITCVKQLSTYHNIYIITSAISICQYLIIMCQCVVGVVTSQRTSHHRSPHHTSHPHHHKTPHTSRGERERVIPTELP